MTASDYAFIDLLAEVLDRRNHGAERSRVLVERRARMRAANKSAGAPWGGPPACPTSDETGAETWEPIP
jgi:hypothetical protein